MAGWPISQLHLLHLLPVPPNVAFGHLLGVRVNAIAVVLVVLELALVGLASSEL